MGMTEFNKLIRKQLYPLLKQMGFEKIGVRKSYKWQDQVIYSLQIKAVGSHFSDVTGWPSSSFTCGIQPYYSFLYDPCDIDKDKDGRIVPPKRWPSEGGLGLSKTIDQSQYTKNLYNITEQKRNSIWWLERDEGNVHAVVDDLVEQVKNFVPQYLSSGIDTVYMKERDFLQPTEEAVKLHIEKASKTGAIYWLKKLIKFSDFLQFQEDREAYEMLLKKINH